MPIWKCRAFFSVCLLSQNHSILVDTSVRWLFDCEGSREKMRLCDAECCFKEKKIARTHDQSRTWLTFGWAHTHRAHFSVLKQTLAPDRPARSLIVSKELINDKNVVLLPYTQRALFVSLLKLSEYIFHLSIEFNLFMLLQWQVSEVREAWKDIIYIVMGKHFSNEWHIDFLSQARFRFQSDDNYRSQFGSEQRILKNRSIHFAFTFRWNVLERFQLFKAKKSAHKLNKVKYRSFKW